MRPALLPKLARRKSTSGDGDPDVKPKKGLLERARYSYRILAPYGRPYRGSLRRGALAAVGVVACRLAFPWPMRAVLQQTINAGNRAGALLHVIPGGDPVAWLVGSFVLIILFWGLFEYVQRLALARFAIAVTTDTHAAAIDSVSSHTTTRDPSDLLSRIVMDNSGLKSGLRSVLINASRNVLFLLCVGAIITIIDWQIGLVFLAGVAGSLTIALIGARHTASVSRKLRRKEIGSIEIVQQAIGGRLASTGPSVLGKASPTATLTKLEGRTTMAIHAWLALTTAAMLLLVVEAGRSGQLSPGDAFIILAYTLYTHNKTVSLGRTTVKLGKVLTSAERMAKLLAKRRQNAGRAAT